MAGRRFRVEFTDEQAEYAEQVGAVWNIGLEQRREYRRRGAWMNSQPRAHELAEAQAGHRWLEDVPGHCVQQTLMDLDRACGERGSCGVRWRSARRWSPSFRFPEGSEMAVEKLNRRQHRVEAAHVRVGEVSADPQLGWCSHPVGHLQP